MFPRRQELNFTENENDFQVLIGRDMKQLH
jgi:hypothetical protein